MKIKRSGKDINLERIILNARNIYLFGDVDTAMATNVVQRFRTLDSLNHRPIVLLINSPGGCVGDGMAIIDTMRMLSSKVYTVILGEALSMAGLIAVCGDIRFVSEHSLWMLHEMRVGACDYLTKVRAHGHSWDRKETAILSLYRKHTKLTDEEIRQGLAGELWLDAQECITKGVADRLLKDI